MKADEFVSLVREMRLAQKKYFAERTQGNLIAARQLETKVDKALAEGIEIPVPGVLELTVTDDEDQLKLFGE